MSGHVLLTGATGFVGRQVLAELSRRGHAVRAVLRPGQPMPDGASEAIRSADALAEGAAWWQEACAGIDTVIHCAWHVTPGEYLTSPRNTDCLIGTLRLGQGARAAGVARLVGIGTCFEYDLSVAVLSTETPLAPTTPYARAKAAAFHGLSGLMAGSQTSFAWARLFYLYGEGEKPGRLVSYLRAQLDAGEPAELTSGRQIRDYMDVAEAGRQIVRLACAEHEGAANICTGTPVTLRQLAESIADVHGRRDLLRFGARADNLVDPPCVLGIPTPLPDEKELT
ncbi:MAG: NAD(P)-dependent oxidoreductase [Rhodobacteraceae bacterium]|nr:NAD(P)-dependent oxidoreductase [Paracoccaceae bacterium]